MKTFLLTLALVALAPLPATAQVKKTINKTSLYSDAVLRQLIRASRLAADRQRSILSRSALGKNETALIRRQSTLTQNDQQQLDRLSAFAGNRLRMLEEMSEFRADEVSRIQADYRSDRPLGGKESNRLAEMAQKNSTMSRPKFEQVLRASDARDWARQVKRRATDIGEFADLLRRRSLLSGPQARLMERISLDK